MNKNKKIVALICAMAMIFSMFASFTVVNAEEITKGIVLEYESSSRTADTAVVVAKAVGFEKVDSYTVNINVPDGVTEVTASGLLISGGVENLANGVYGYSVATATAVDVPADGVLGRFEFTLPSTVTDSFDVTLQEKSGISYGSEKLSTVRNNLPIAWTTVKIPSAEPTPTAKPTEPSISVKASSTTVEFDKKFTVTATVKNAKDGAKVAFTTNDDEKYAVIFGTPTEINSKGETKATYVANDKAGTVTITATYKDTEGNEKSASVKVTVKKASTTTGGNDGTTSGGGPSIIAPGHTGAVTTPNTNTNYKPDFQDLDSVEWARTAINGLAMRGMISGRDQYTFDPNANITRAEYCQILMGAINALNAKGESTFADVPSTAWYYNAVSVASQLGIVSGYGDGNFGPNDLITRQDMALMTYKTAKIMNKSLEPVNAEITFEDSHEISDYAFEAVMTLQKAGIINGMTDTTFEPHSNATRAQSAKVIFDTFVDAQ